MHEDIDEDYNLPPQEQDPDYLEGLTLTEQLMLASLPEVKEILDQHDYHYFVRTFDDQDDLDDFTKICSDLPYEVLMIPRRYYYDETHPNGTPSGVIKLNGTWRRNMKLIYKAVIATKEKKDLNYLKLAW